MQRLASLVFVLSQIATSVFAAQSSYQLIQQAYESGQLTYQEKLLMEVRSLKDQSTLPPQFQSAVIEFEKCATDILLQVRNNWSLFDANQQQELRNFLARPSATHSYSSLGGKFVIHYNISGPDAVPTTDVNPANGIPDYVEWLGSYADSSYRAIVVNLGQLEPPSDGSLGGDSRYDIYTEEMGYYGYTQAEGYGSYPWNDAYSYISVHRNFIGFPPNNDPEGDQKGAAKVTVAHEYSHAVQFAYNYQADLWFMEETSTWMEEHVFDPVDDNYNYLSSWFTAPYLSLHLTNSDHEYSGFIWPLYLAHIFGAEIMPDVWDQFKTVGISAYTALTTVIAAYGSNLNTQFAIFCDWNFITNTRDDSEHYREGSAYPLIATVRTHTTYPVSGQGPLSGKAPDAMGSNYVIFNLPTEPGEFTIDFNGDNSTPWIVRILTWKSSPENVYADHLMSLDANSDGSYVLSNPTDWNKAVMVICNVSQSLNDRSYSYGASFAAGPQYAVSVTAAADDSLYSHTSTTLKFRIQNIGALADNFAINVSDNLGWQLVPSRTNIYLVSGALDSVSVLVVSPALVGEGVLDGVVLTATAQSAMGVSDRDTATVLVFLQYGDADNSGSIDISDVTYIISYAFTSGPPPVPVLLAGDANCDETVDISDCVYLIDYIFNSAPPAPCNPL